PPFSPSFFFPIPAPTSNPSTIPAIMPRPTLMCSAVDRATPKHMTANYSNVGYITSPLAVDPEGSREHAARYARDHNWNLIEVEGDLSLMEQLLNGPWDEDKFLVVPPGYRIASAPGIEKVRAVKA
ncbi:MAG: DUF1638 domain-containing protein, partial [Eggerthellaceae bacterium]|nr:DUF1638 domain-containing protein [Eggerthellaceae bacterium]